MKFVSLNEVNSSISGHVVNLDDRYFNKIDLSIGLFQSPKYEYVEWSEGNKLKRVPAVLVPKKEFQWLKLLFSEINELENPFQSDIGLIVWFGKSVLQKEKHNSDHIVAHELRHIEQRYVDLNTIYKDRVLDFIPHGYPLPTEIDADYFANKTTSRDYDRDYNWIDEVNKLFERNKEKIKSINLAIAKNNTDIIIDNEYYHELSLDQNKRDLFQYYFKKIRPNK